MEERRAQKLFQLNSLELKRYYDQALSQRAAVFFVGVVCILAGFCAVGAAFWILNTVQGLDLSEKIVVAALGQLWVGSWPTLLQLSFCGCFQRSSGRWLSFTRAWCPRTTSTSPMSCLRRSRDEELRNHALAEMAKSIASFNAPSEAMAAEPKADAPG